MNIDNQLYNNITYTKCRKMSEFVMWWTSLNANNYCSIKW